MPNWDQYKKIVNNFAKDVNKCVMIWVRGQDIVEQFKEEEHESGVRVPLNVLIGYNVFRTWPITQQTNSGELDNENMFVWINKQYLRDLGYLTSKGYFDFKPDKDYFIYEGMRYKCEGHTAISQASDDELHIGLVMHREEVLTGSALFDYPETQRVIQELETETLYARDYGIT